LQSLLCNTQTQVLSLLIFNKKVKLNGWQDKRKRLTLPQFYKVELRFFNYN
jgi:ribosome-associated protein YbcJ (S4-like RNA binding protein)